MSRAQQVFGLGILLAVVSGLGYAGWRMRSSSNSTFCRVCSRTIHADMRTVAIVGDKREVFCCPTCALSAGAQWHKTVRFERLSDYATSRPLLPANAFAVEGSDVVPCVHSQEMLNRDGLPVPMAYDRCSPSIICFANRASAERFASEHGGNLTTFRELISRRGNATTESPDYSPQDRTVSTSTRDRTRGPAFP
jgi:hypothetical protein